MTASQRWALVVGFFLFGALIIGGVVWRQTSFHEAPVALTSSQPLASTSGAAAPAAPPSPVVADHGPQPPSAPNPSPAEATKDAATKDAAAKDPAKDPQFDIVRVEPTGETVLAGKGAPDADVAVVASGKVVATAKADANGHFVVLPPPLKPGSYDLSLRQTPPGKPATDSSQSVAVSVPEKGKGPVVVALAEPGKATRMLSAPPEAATPNAPAKTDAAPAAAQTAKVEDSAKTVAPETTPATTAEVKFAIRSVDLENGTGFFASGTAKPGTAVRLYLNDSHVADVVASADGQWTVKVRKGLTGGHYTVRADAMAGDTVVTRAEVPFDVPVAMAEAPSPFTAPNPSESAAPEDPHPRPDIVAAAHSASPADASKPPVARNEPTPGSVPSAEPAKAAPAAPSAPAAPQTAAATPAAPTADAVVDEVRTALVVAGDNLWNISRARLGHGTRYTQIYAANAGQIRDPKLIYPGQIFVVPHQ